MLSSVVVEGLQRSSASQLYPKVNKFPPPASNLSETPQYAAVQLGTTARL